MKHCCILLILRSFYSSFQKSHSNTCHTANLCKRVWIPKQTPGHFKGANQKTDTTIMYPEERLLQNLTIRYKHTSFACPSMSIDRISAKYHPNKSFHLWSFPKHIHTLLICNSIAMLWIKLFLKTQKGSFQSHTCGSVLTLHLILNATESLMCREEKKGTGNPYFQDLKNTEIKLSFKSQCF